MPTEKEIAMNRSTLDMPSLFAQLGQADDMPAITHFIESHSPLPGATLLHEAAFWTASQACFLREAILDDAEWAEIVDALNTELHTRH